MSEKILLTFLKKEFFRLKVMYLKQKKKNQKKNLKCTLMILSYRFSEKSIRAKIKQLTKNNLFINNLSKIHTLKK